MAHNANRFGARGHSDNGGLALWATAKEIGNRFLLLSGIGGALGRFLLLSLG
jgi:hypothetical protein